MSVISVNDELRKLTADYSKSVMPWELYEIAARIDAEMAELPRGKDGRPIHVDDTLYDSDGTQWTVTHIYYYSPDDGPDVVAQHGNAEINFEPSDYHGMTHERPDSWERITQELEDMSENFRATDKESFSALLDFADRIRRLAEMEDKHERE